MNSFKLYGTLLRTCCRDSFFSAAKQFKFNGTALTDEEAAKKKKKTAARIGGGIVIGIGLIFIMAYLVIYVMMLTVSAVSAGMHRELLYTLLAFVQLIVLFFGSMTTLNYLYFGKDNQLLVSLPLSSGTIFAVKFTMSYLSELIICALMALPMLVTYGITCSAYGVAIGAGFYIFGIIAIFLLPILPLLVISLLSIPLMYFASFLKHRAVGKMLVTLILSVAVMAIYFLIIGGVASMGETEDGMPQMSAGVTGMLAQTAKITIFNYNLVQALLGVNSALNFLIFLGSLLAVFALVVVMSMFFYRKGISVVMEEGGGSKKRKKSLKENSYANVGFRRSFFIKEVKTIFGTPQLLLNSVIGLVAIPLLIVIFGTGNMFNFSQEGAPASMGGELGLIGFVCYFASIMIASTNMISLVGFSMEGKNLQVLKTLPILPKDILIGKLGAANILSCVTALITAVTFIAVSSFHNVLIGLAIFVVLLFNGLASSGIGLYSDMNNPNFRFTNLNELTKNNKKAIKPMIANLLIGFAYMVLGIVFSIITTGENPFSAAAAYAVFFVVMFLTNALFAFITIKKLFDKVDERFAEMEV